MTQETCFAVYAWHLTGKGSHLGTLASNAGQEVHAGVQPRSGHV